MSDDGELRPCLRPVEAVPVEVEGRRLMALHDSEGFSDETAVVAEEILPLLGMFDGTHSLRDIQLMLLQLGAPLTPVETLKEIVDALDRCLLLDNERFRGALQERERAFDAEPTRKATHAGAAYPPGRAEAGEFLDEIAGRVEPLPARAVRRLIAPHIDLGLGAEVHATARAALSAAGRPDLAVVLGVCHGPSEQRFVACRKDFETPFGTVPHAGAFLDRLEQRLGFDPTRGHLVHRGEHSVEFQALWLAHLWPDDPPPIVPFLIGSFHPLIEEERLPSEDPAVTAFCEALRETLAEEGGEAVVVASVDLAHMGPRYGHEQGLDEAGEQRLEDDDRRILEPVLAGDADGFFSAVSQDGNANNVCGVAPIYVTLALGEGQGDLLRYGQGRIDPDTGSVVSFATVAFGD